MSEWFQAKVKYLRQLENGLIKKVSETYLVDSQSFTECEARVTHEIEGFKELTMMAISRSNISEAYLYGDTDQFFKVKATYTDVDESTGKEKKFTTYLLINAADVRDAHDRASEHLNGLMVTYEIVAVAHSPICEVYKYRKIEQSKEVDAYFDEDVEESYADLEQRFGNACKPFERRMNAAFEGDEATMTKSEMVWKMIMDGTGMGMIQSEIDDIESEATDGDPLEEFIPYMEIQHNIDADTATDIWKLYNQE